MTKKALDMYLEEGGLKRTARGELERSILRSLIPQC